MPVNVFPTPTSLIPSAADAAARERRGPRERAATGPQPQKGDPQGITWHVLAGGTWTGSRPPYACRIEPAGAARGENAYRVTITKAGVRAPIATTEARTISLARSWIATQFPWLDARTPPPQATPRKTTFEVAIHVERLTGQEIYDRLTRRMLAEAKRLGLSNPRRTHSLRDTSLPNRPAEVWMCKGEPS